MHLSISESTLHANRAFGALLVGVGSLTTITNTSLSGTTEGGGAAPGSPDSYEGLADGLVAIGPALVYVVGSELTGNERTGALGAEGADFRFFSTVAAGARFGLVLQQNSVYQQVGSSFYGTEQDILTDGDLPVPEPPPVPEQ
jgi:hypothetical protein